MLTKTMCIEAKCDVCNNTIQIINGMSKMNTIKELRKLGWKVGIGENGERCTCPSCVSKNKEANGDTKIHTITNTVEANDEPVEITESTIISTTATPPSAPVFTPTPTATIPAIEINPPITTPVSHNTIVAPPIDLIPSLGDIIANTK